MICFECDKIQTNHRIQENLSLERSPDERATRRGLVENLRTKIKEESEFHHFIKDVKICLTDRKLWMCDQSCHRHLGVERKIIICW